MKTLRLLAITVTLAVTTLLSGCQTFNAQSLDLHPSVQVSRVLDKEKRIEVVAQDLRKSAIIGHRYTGDKNAPSIVLKDSLHLLKHTTEHALEDMGIRRFYGGEFLLTIKLVELNYQTTASKIKQTVDVDTKIQITVSKDNKSYTGSYQADKKQAFVGIPSEEENEKLIGKLVSTAMNLAMNDQQLLDFIQFN